MSQALFDLYKEALRRGHVAAVQGNLEAALVAYEAAATIAPDRALPHASLGDVLKRLGRLDAAEQAFDAALQRAPADENALRGRAATRLELRRPIDAARDLETLTDVLERANRIPDACNAACAALEIAETRARRQAVERLAAALTEIGTEASAAAALARAEPFLDPNRPKVVAEPPVAVEASPEPKPMAETAVAAEEPAGIEAAEPEAAAVEPEAAEPDVAEPEAIPEPELAAEPEAVPEPEVAAEPEPAAEVEVPVEPEPLIEPEAAESEVEPRARFHVVAARAEAETLLVAGDRDRARPLLLRIAEAERLAGRLDAAIDACLILVTIDPADTAVQLELATIQAARGWTDLARDKIALLTRLADLNEDPGAQALVRESAVVRELSTTHRQDRKSTPRD